MDRYKCRFCFKSFINGRALGGHMRSHMLTLSSKRELFDLSLEDEEEEERPSQLTEYDVTESDASSSSDEEEEEDNPKRNRVVDEDESETESFPTRKRSKRTRKLGSFDFDMKTSEQQQKLGESVTEPESQHHHHHNHSSEASDTTTEEDLAFCLILLSRDKWKTHEDYETEHESEEDYKSRKNRGRGRFKCETCGKVFKSYQALGGHRASHKKNKIIKTTTKTEQVEKTEYVNGVKKRIHECPICFRVFSSGQALGGHKRSHGSIINNNNNFSVNRIEKDNGDDEVLSVKQRMIDLNLPAPNEEDDETISVVFQ